MRRPQQDLVGPALLARGVCVSTLLGGEGPVAGHPRLGMTRERQAPVLFWMISSATLRGTSL